MTHLASSPCESRGRSRTRRGARDAARTRRGANASERAPEVARRVGDEFAPDAVGVAIGQALGVSPKISKIELN